MYIYRESIAVYLFRMWLVCAFRLQGSWGSAEIVGVSRSQLTPCASSFCFQTLYQKLNPSHIEADSQRLKGGSWKTLMWGHTLTLQVLIHEEYIQSKKSHSALVRWSSLHKETVHVLVGLSVPPCQHDWSLLHTERLWWVEVSAEAEKWCIPHIIQPSCSHRGSWCPHHAMMTLSAVWHMMCVQTVSTYSRMGPAYLLTVLCGSHTACWSAAEWKGHFSCKP